jgi:hypothetical protein
MSDNFVMSNDLLDYSPFDERPAAPLALPVPVVENDERDAVALAESVGQPVGAGDVLHDDDLAGLRADAVDCGRHHFIRLAQDALPRVQAAA